MKVKLAIEVKIDVARVIQAVALLAVAIVKLTEHL